MSIRRAITLTVLAVVLLTSTLVGVLGILRIQRSVDQSTQERVANSLNMFENLFVTRVERVAGRVRQAAEAIKQDQSQIAAAVERLRAASDVQVLHVCDSEGRSLSRPSLAAPVPVAEDPVLRRALAGEASHGVVLLSEERLIREGGAALRNATHVDGAQGALFWWAAEPLVEADGTVSAVVYGGDSINLDFDLVDQLRDLVFPARSYHGKPLGTVTVFLEDTRVATNVRQADQSRAVGTAVSDEVRRAVLERGETWNDRAWVVDAWYRSAYAPLRDPDETPIGMLYVGLLEAPYRDAVRTLAIEFAAVTVGGAALTILLVVVMVRRITTPLGYLGEASARMADGDLDHRLPEHTSYRDLNQLSASFRHMQEAIHRRDLDLQASNRELERANTELDRANKNYMTTLGFVTHELRSPLAAMQSIIDMVVAGYLGDVPEAINGQLVRIKRNCEEMQDMVKNYLDLARAERGELVPRMADLDYASAVLHPCVEQVQALLDSRALRLELTCPDRAPMRGDEELLRIALVNYLTNAAKYGREGGRVRASVDRGPRELVVTVWNEGVGFQPDDREKLFGKFSRLKNETTASKRGSGLGLFLCRRIVEQHGGRVWAESEPGKWALFGMALPVDGLAEGLDAPEAKSERDR